MDGQSQFLATSADWGDDDYYDDDYYYDDYSYNDDDDDDDNYFNPNYIINDGITVNLFGYENSTIDLSSGMYGTAVNISAAYSYAFNALYGNYASNAILAGVGPTYLWGGQDTASDVLVGGWSYDVFYYGKNEGFDMIQNASSVDNVNLYDSTLSDIVATYYDGVTLSLQFNTGNFLNVGCTDYVSPVFILSDGSAYTFNRATYSWQ